MDISLLGQLYQVNLKFINFSLSIRGGMMAPPPALDTPFDWMTTAPWRSQAQEASLVLF
jgi:hypothetical protein